MPPFFREKGEREMEQQITLRPAQVELAEEAAEYYRRNRLFLAPFEPPRPEEFFTPEHQRTILEQEVRAWEAKTGYRFYLSLPEEPERVIGIIGLNNIVWGAFRSAFLGYKLDGACQGRGYMTQAVDQVTRFAFQEAGLHRIEANVMPRNKASLRVLEKNGYQAEGLARHYLNIGGVWEDHIHMVKLNYAMHGPGDTVLLP